MLDRIIVPLDGSPLAEAILTRLEPLVLESQSELVLLMAISPGSAAMLPVATLNDVMGQTRRQARWYLESVAADLEVRGIRARADVQLDQPVEAILNATRRHDAPLIAMTTHGRSGAARWLLGSVAERVLRATPVPLLLLRSFEAGPDGEVAPKATSVRPARILVPVDGSGGARALAPMIGGLAGQLGAAVDLLRVVVSPSDYGSTSRAEGALEGDRAAFARAGVAADTHLRHAADAANGILDFCRKEQDVGLIAMRTHGRDGVARWALGSVTETVARRADVPLLVVRRPPRDLSEWQHAAAHATQAEAME